MFFAFAAQLVRLSKASLCAESSRGALADANNSDTGKDGSDRYMADVGQWCKCICYLEVRDGNVFVYMCQ